MLLLCLTCDPCVEQESWWKWTWEWMRCRVCGHFPPEPILVSGIKNQPAAAGCYCLCWLVSLEMDGCEWLLLQMLLHLWVLSGRPRRGRQNVRRPRADLVCQKRRVLSLCKWVLVSHTTVVQSRKCWSMTEQKPRLELHWCLLINRETRGERQQGKPGGGEEAGAPGTQHAANTWMSYTGLEEGMAANCR